MVKRVLMIAFHFPPMRGSSGIQRTLKFSRYLPEHGWEPLVLTAHPRAYPDCSDDQMHEVPPHAKVRRATAFDAARHYSVAGRYPAWLALPDRWASWLLGALPAGLSMLRCERPLAIWSTYPIATAHLAALALHKLSGLPWIADMRDPMTDEGYPPDRLTRTVAAWIERKTIEHCTVAVCTTAGALRAYAARFPSTPQDRFALIENGYDDDNFSLAAPRARSCGKPFTLLHSGLIYASERDPTALFEAVAALNSAGRLDVEGFRLVLRAPGSTQRLAQLAERHGVTSLVTIAPPIPYQDALSEMLAADGLLILQASNCNRQVPAKLYEYLRARRPILALTDTAGDTAAVLRHAGIDTVAPLDDSAAIVHALDRFIGLACRGQAPLADDGTIAACSRRARSAQLAALLDRVSQREQ